MKKNDPNKQQQQSFFFDDEAQNEVSQQIMDSYSSGVVDGPSFAEIVQDNENE